MSEHEADLHNRFKTMIGQMQTIDNLLEKDVPCETILMQINAVRSALQKAGQFILDGHLDHCVMEGIEHGNLQKTMHDFRKEMENFSTKPTCESCSSSYAKW